MKGFLTVCAEPGCYELVVLGRCPQHRTAYDAEIRGRTRSWAWVYRDPRWRALRARVRSEQLTCAVDGCDEIWSELDHKTPTASGGAPFDRSNVEGLCKKHHSEKTAGEVWRG